MMNRAAYLELEAFTDLGWDGILELRRRAAANGTKTTAFAVYHYVLWDFWRVLCIMHH